MKIPFCDLYRQYCAIKNDIDKAIKIVIEESAFIRGRHVDAFEQSFGELIGAKFCISCANGTDAIYIVLKALGIGPGDEVITTAHSWISTSETITQAGARVVFVDTEPDTYCIDPNKIEKKITSKTKAIIPVHLYGHPADMNPILKIAKKYGLKIIEDCAQAHLAKYHGSIVGTLGDAATFSFYPGKNLGAMGDAGCITTNCEKIAYFCTTFARHGGKNEHLIEGVNSRMDGIQAAILNAKLPYLENWNEQRKKLANRYSEKLKNISELVLPVIKNECDHVFHLYVIKSQDREQLKEHLKRNYIETVLNYPKALPFYQAYKYLNHSSEDFPVAFSNQGSILSLPIFPFMSTEEQDYIINCIYQFCRQKN